VCRIDRDKHAPLTLANLGFNTKFGTTTKNKRNKPENLKVNYPNEAPKSRTKAVGSNKTRVGTRLHLLQSHFLSLAFLRR